MSDNPYIYNPPPPPPPKSYSPNSNQSNNNSNNRRQRNNNQRNQNVLNRNHPYNRNNGQRPGYHNNQQLNQQNKNPNYNIPSSYAQLQASIQQPAGPMPYSTNVYGTSNKTTQQSNTNKDKKPTQAKQNKTQKTQSQKNSKPNTMPKPDNDEEEEDDDNFEDEEANANPSRLIIVPGTSITLNTQQEIEEWIAERRQKWPTKERIEIKQKLLEDLRQERQTPSHIDPDSNNKPMITENKQEQDTPEEPTTTNDSTVKKANSRICKYFAKNGRCLNGNKCSYIHQHSGDNTTNTNNPFATQKVYKRFEAVPKLPLFQMLVRNDMENENRKILAFIEYLYLQGKLN